MELPKAYLKERVTLETLLAEYNFEEWTEDALADWQRLRAKMQDGDELWRFEPPEGAIRIFGVALVREGHVISTLIEAIE